MIGEIKKTILREATEKLNQENEIIIKRGELMRNINSPLFVLRKK